MITLPDKSVVEGNFLFAWDSKAKLYNTYYIASSNRFLCQVVPYKNEEGTIGDPKKMFTVKAKDYPGVGNLEQMVKGSDLVDYVDSIRLGRGM